MVKRWVVVAKDNTFHKRIRALVKANTKEKAKEYAIRHFQSDGYSNFQIIEVKNAD